MNWGDERYVRIYCRNTADLIGMGWEARAMLWELLRNADRSGVIAIGKHGVSGLAAMMHVPTDVLRASLATLEADGAIRVGPHEIVIPNFLPAQETPRSDAARKALERERKRERAMLEATPGHDGVTPSHELVTQGHESSHAVTSRHAESLCAVPSVPSVPAVQDLSAKPPSDAGASRSQPPLELEVNEPPRRDEIREVWDHFLATRAKHFGKPEPVLNEKRRKQIRARIATHGVENCKRAVLGLFADDFMIGEGYTTPEQVFESDEKLEKRLQKAPAPTAREKWGERQAWGAEGFADEATRERSEPPLSREELAREMARFRDGAVPDLFRDVLGDAVPDEGPADEEADAALKAAIAALAEHTTPLRPSGTEGE